MTPDLPGNVEQPLKETIMKTKFAATALILASGLIASTSFAADTGALTREQVRATVLQARADGSLTQMNEWVKNTVNAAAKSAPSTVTREAVRAEYVVAKKAGYLPVEPGYVSAAEPAFVSTRTRAEVRTDAVIAAHTRAQEFGG